MKKKIFAIAVAACLAVLMIAGASLAYFTDTQQYTNVFTAGNVKISLTEAPTAQDAYRNVVTVAGDRDAVNLDTVYNPLFPKQTIAKDPTIKNIGTEEAYFGAIITITNVAPSEGATVGNVKKVLAPAANDANNRTYVGDFIKGLPAAEVATVTIEETASGFVVYVAAYAKDAFAVVFTGMEIPSAWNNNEMAELNGMKIDVKAYATQTAGMTAGSLAALKDAFDDFDSLS